MRINEIRLYNFGSYEGLCEFSFKTADPEKRVVIIGGKNGAGKTTLFTAIQICLYGHYAFGYKTAGKFYLKEIYNLLNSKARLNEKARAYVEVSFDHVDQSELKEYVVKREWYWPNSSLKENVEVYQNDHQLQEEELSNFQKYLLHLIPPDLLNLYFFDGEKIAEYFLNNGEANIHDALMVLSGNDTFDILHNNVEKLLKSSEDYRNSANEDYLNAKKKVEVLSDSLKFKEIALKQCDEALEECLIDIEAHKQEYAKRGGVTFEKWKYLQNKVKDEEAKRERLKFEYKVAATEILPFLIMEDLLADVSPQIKRENEYRTNSSLKTSLESKSFVKVVERALDQIGSKDHEKDSRIILEYIQSYLIRDDWNDFKVLFDLSKDEELAVHTCIGKVEKFSRKKFAIMLAQINQSYEKSKELRKILENSDIENYQEFIGHLKELEDRNNKLTTEREVLIESVEAIKDELDIANAQLQTAKKALEEKLKRQSVSTLSGRVLLLLEDLQESLQETIIKQVEEDLNKKFKQLIRKNGFFSWIKVEQDFSVHILREQMVKKEDLLSLLRSSSLANLTKALGSSAAQEIKVLLKAENVDDLRENLEKAICDAFLLPVEIDQHRLSSGEKQIFVMALYWAMMNQSKNNLPFVIDTPFARIDSVHRENITREFFKQLSGQLIILSTDEEVSGEHLGNLSDQISHKFMLEYGEDKATHIHSDSYFEV